MTAWYNFLRSSPTIIKSVNPKAFEGLKRLNISNIFDLLYHMPYRVIKKKVNPLFEDIKDQDQVVISLKIYNLKQNFSKISIHCHYQGREIALNFFNKRMAFLLKQYKIGDFILVDGKIAKYKNSFNINHPKILSGSELSDSGVELVYPLTYGMLSRQINDYAIYAIKKLQDSIEFLPSYILKTLDFPLWLDNIKSIHEAKSDEILNPFSKYKQRIAFEELLCHQLIFKIIKRRHNKKILEKREVNQDLYHKVLETLGFALTIDQSLVLQEIMQEIVDGKRLTRLIQGDVGCGKTAIALLAACLVMSDGGQVAIMAPTDLLAKQHKAWIDGILTQHNVVTAILTGKMTAASRRNELALIASGRASLVIGTHALFQDNVEFAALKMIIVDEQHRFGVDQRLKLAEKGENTHILLMSATPIPRTLAMALYGDLDVSIVKTKPANRKPIETYTISLKQVDEVIKSLVKQVADGEKVYWICPLIDNDEDEEYTEKLMSVTTRYNELKKYFPDNCAVIHGKTLKTERDEAMQQFLDGQIKVLVSTTVIEVGVNVPDATIMIIEHAERFGLAQLHQLRGRVGRGEKQSKCLLLYGIKISDVTRERLKVMKATNDGFLIAEKDLEIRGSGDIAGTKQSGLPEFNYADLSFHADLLKKANYFAEKILAEDEYLQSEEGIKIKMLMDLHGKTKFLADEEVVMVKEEICS